MLAAVAIPRVDYRHWRDFRGAACTVIFGMADYNHIRITSDNPDGILHLLAFHLRRKHAGILCGQDPAAESMHGSLETETSPGRRCIEKRGHDAVLVVE